MSIERRKYAKDPEVLQAGVDAFNAAKANWADQNNPTDEELCDAKLAKLNAMIAAADAKLAAE